MSIRAAEIVDGKVVNIILAESLDFKPNLVEAGSANIGDSYADGVFSPPPPPPPEVPRQVTMRQARLALRAAGKLADVDDAIASLPSPQKEEAQIEWEFSSVVERERQLVQMLGPALGLSESDLDQLFITAATL